ncbi:MAG: hypothetical protein A3B10_02120 [Candidatus Doudnabacteria bacterium RIFCSPLOWO2_01_FULL_44_21]|uniref:Uncharacterized protein n=1 Tax=Candidatus Doudnabacteria bacterium RIFCSPLOWO2_01_FULL_44_21 TaxID=1817841 RepID=A0A1F5Q5C1_9BACT|nr:MAG: hypothetical protein A3B95_00230 [Candidatus Doudnabacteria bacterium RIFCSPHIGHO2_02_FULL_43_13b]OGE97369.1 MAG: hypothetical protein A3B10_02120 [Candidatus Doudnabacteria bacterium RIFCSPLOWO2_01_FULL_44_21]
MANPEIINYIPPAEDQDSDCTACHQVYGTNPYCSRCKKTMTTEDIARRKKITEFRGDVQRRILKNKKTA